MRYLILVYCFFASYIFSSEYWPYSSEDVEFVFHTANRGNIRLQTKASVIKSSESPILQKIYAKARKNKRAPVSIDLGISNIPSWQKILVFLETDQLYFSTCIELAQLIFYAQTLKLHSLKRALLAKIDQGFVIAEEEISKVKPVLRLARVLSISQPRELKPDDWLVKILNWLINHLAQNQNKISYRYLFGPFSSTLEKKSLLIKFSNGKYTFFRKPAPQITTSNWGCFNFWSLLVAKFS